MRRLICTFVVRIWLIQVFSWRGSYFVLSDGNGWTNSLGPDQTAPDQDQHCLLFCLHRHGVECLSEGKWAAAWQNQTNDLCAQRRLRSAWASAQSDQNLRYALNMKLRTQGFFMRTAKSLIRLGGCSGWSESSLAAHSILLVLSCAGSSDKDLPCISTVLQVLSHWIS